MDDHGTKTRRKPLSWCKLIISALIPCVLGIFTILFTLQQQDLSKQQQQQERWHQLDSQRQTSFNAYIDDISKFLAQEMAIHPVIDKTSLLYIRTKTLTVLRTLDAERKKYVLLFLYESGLIRNSGLDLRGADLNNVQLIGPYKLDNLYLPDVFLSNVTFVDCHLKNATFDRSVMNNARFIRSTLESASLGETVLNNTDFTGTTIIFANFTGAFLIGANFLSAEVVQGLTFTNSDLFEAHFTEEQFQGQRATMLAHNFSHARLPNGTFGPIDAKKNLIQNGDAERNVKTRVTQIIDLRLYSLLIDAGQGVFAASALMGCDVPGNNAYMSVSMQRSDGLIQGQRLYLSSDGIKLDDTFVMQPHQIRVQRMIEYTRRVTITFGVETLPKSGTWCYFDHMAFIVRQTI
ncbi:unnamed protein product [Rotaria sp. Silwood1]|nr:unnamed protein product [Rotaria sp. Silwood1]CAF1373030.1 unnamed protein product [Rotaria sp. Silwood1]CAF4591023.1 unnamed protein product [Rotaria sp. Silwood1]